MTTPPPPPVDKQYDLKTLEDEFAAGNVGYDGKDDSLRVPEHDEYVTDEGRIAPIFTRIRDMRRKRSLSKLATFADIQQELSRLYADVHHGRIGSGEFTKRSYVLNLMAQVMRMAGKMEPNSTEPASM